VYKHLHYDTGETFTFVVCANVKLLAVNDIKDTPYLDEDGEPLPVITLGVPPSDARVILWARDELQLPVTIQDAEPLSFSLSTR
jgi:hypothetical protein